jgi:hypothetical protein
MSLLLLIYSFLMVNKTGEPLLVNTRKPPPLIPALRPLAIPACSRRLVPPRRWRIAPPRRRRLAPPHRARPLLRRSRALPAGDLHRPAVGDSHRPAAGDSHRLLSPESGRHGRVTAAPIHPSLPRLRSQFPSTHYKSGKNNLQNMSSDCKVFFM